jgi:hypothetical protein
VRTVVLVEGRSDRCALEAAAGRRGQDLAGVEIVAMGGASNAARYASAAGADVRLVGLCDVGERRLFATAFARAGRGDGDLFVCDRDLEDELLRALGADRVEAVIERAGELDSLRTLQQMPFHRGRTVGEHLHRFIGTRSGRKERYASLLTSALAADELPAPLRELLDAVTQPRAAGRARSPAPPPR